MVALQTMTNFQKTQSLIKGAHGSASMTDLNIKDFSKLA